MEAALEPESLTPPPLSPFIEYFLEKLPRVQVRDLSEDHKNCNICMEQFTDEAETEKPIRLRCGHIFGSFCIKSWASSSPASQPTCPMCRKTMPSSSSIERWEYLATLMQQRPYISQSKSLRRVGTFALEDWAAAVEFVSLFFTVVMEVRAWYRRKRIAASALLLGSARSLAVHMGHLYVLLKPTMELMGVAVPWGEGGPPVITILDSEYRRGFEEAFETLAHMERRLVSDSTSNLMNV